MKPINSKPDPQAKGFNWPNARACLDWCAAAYTEIPSIFSVKTDAELLLYEFPDCIIVAFRGSEDPLDYLQDAKFRLVQLNYPAGDIAAEVHEGFLQDFDSISASLTSAIKSVPSKPIFVTGHSLGGGIAILCASDFVRIGLPVAGVYTFGQPRVGDRLFASFYDTQKSETLSNLCSITWRVVDQNDIVPRIPPVIFGYRHCGNEIFLPTGGGWSLNPPLWTKLLSDGLGFFYAWRHKGDVLISDHHIQEYQDRIKTLE